MGQQLELFPRQETRMPALGLISKPPRRGRDVGMSVTVLQSGSAGNATLIQAGKTNILIDCGLRPNILRKRLTGLGLTPADITAVLVTHEHGDHLGGCGSLASQFDVPLYMTEGTLKGGAKKLRSPKVRNKVRILPVRGWLAFDKGQEVDRDPDSVDLSVDWVPVSHDGLDTVSYAVQKQNFRFGVLTDLGRVTTPVQKMVSTLDAMSLEANHDIDLLRMSSYPPFVIRRILGSGGHLSNSQAAMLLKDCGGERLKTILLAHISQKANDPERAMKAIEPVAKGKELLLTDYFESIETLKF
ncbi:MAG: MBL fold metallo-hydrolase [Planctomycetota bacterium]|nr:MBL fold metallo-hydrolase [Planctomycetota bacterium]